MSAHVNFGNPGDDGGIVSRFPPWTRRARPACDILSAHFLTPGWIR